MGNSTTVTATLKILADVSSAQSSVSKLASTFSKIKFSDSLKSEMSAAFSKFDKQVEEFKTKLQQPIETKGQANTLNKGAQEIKKSYDEILKYIKSAEKELTAEGVDLSKIFKIDGSTQGKITELNNQIKNLKKVFQDFGNVDLAKATDGSFATLKTNAGDAGKSIQTIAEAAESATRKVQTLGQGKFTLSDNAKDAVTQFTTLETTINSITTKSNQDTRLGIIEALNKGDLETAQKKLQELYSNYERLASRQGDSETWQKNILAVGTALEAVNSLLNATNNATSGLETEKFKIINDAVTQMIEALAGAVAGALNTQGAIDGVVLRTRSMTEAQLEYNSSMEQMKSRIQYFFSINNAVQLLQRTLRSAFDTVKELDAAMTETATVTDFSVSDMWDQLPRYTQAANELGTTTLGAYETMTLFYQQGLDTNEVFQIGTETMKMARIAGLDYEDATNKMTAALRGFNMELNETSATRVNDVYSELAAITAADTEEIATAMTKTASIADSANMEFETTSAFLSQIIETTRESAETAGTAMKTIVARFQELKKDPAEIELVDGESVDANKIETALRSVGVALRDTEGQFRDLDDVFLDLASRWDSLDLNTQRYIATMAAGSRQQSRFIAMMQDYDRTMELVNAAYDSNGSSQKQFEKTTESLESKLNELKNAWNEFAMGIANSDIIKGGVDLLTQIITIFNKITQSGNSLWSMVKKLTAAFAGFKTAKVLLNGLLSGFTSLKTGGGLFDGIFSGLKKTATKEFSGLATIFKRVFTQQGWKGTDSYNSILGGLTSGAAQTSASTYESALERSRVAATNLQQAELNLKKAQEARAKAEQAFAASGRNQSEKKLTTANVTRAEATAQQEVAAAKTENAAATAGLNAVEQNYIASKELLTGLEQAGLSTEQMAVLLSDEKTRAILEQAVAEGALSDVLKDEAIQQQLNNQMQQQGILGNIKARLVTIGKGKASLFSAAAQKSNNAAMLAGLGTMLIYIGIAAVLAAGIYLFANAIETNKEKQERLNKVIEQSNDAYNNLTSDIKTLNDSMEELGSLEEEFDKLVKGTSAWDNKLAEVNEKISSIISDFPELAKYLEINTDGKFSLSEEGVSEYTTGLEKAQNNALLKSLGAQKELTSVNKDNAYQDFINSIVKSTGIINYGKDENGNVQYFSKDDTNSIIAYMQELADQGYISADEMGEVNAAYAEYINELNRLTSEEKAIVDSFVNSVMANNTDYDNLKYKDVTSELASRRLEENYVSSDEWKGKTVGKLETELKNLGVSKIEIEQALEGADGWEERRAALRSLLASKTNENAIDNYIEEIAEAFAKIKDSDVADKIASIFADEGAGISYETLKTYLPNSESDSLSLENILEGTGYNSVEEMAGAFGFDTVNEFGDMIYTNLNNARKEYQRKYTSLAKSYGKATQVGTGKIITNIEEGSEDLSNGYKEVVNRIQALQDRYSAEGIDFVDVAENVDTSLQASGNNQLANLGNQAFLEMSEDTQTTGKDLQDIQNFVNSFDWSNPIDGAAAFKDELTRGSGASKEFAESLQDIADQTFSASAQMQYFIKSSDFEGVQEELDDILDTQDEISAQDVRSLANSYKSLDKMLDNGVTTAEGLARALTLISEGSLSFTDLTDNVMTAMSSMSSLEQMSAETLETLSKFDPGIDENEVGDFMGTAYETISENLAKGAVGNSQNFEYLDFLFPGWSDGLNLEAFNGDWDRLEDETYARMKQYLAILEQNQSDMGMSWANLAEGKDITGEGEANLQALEDANLAVTRLADGGVALTAADGGAITATTEEVVAALAEAYGVSEQYAQMMLTDFSNYSAGLALELQGNDFASGIQKVYDGLELTKEKRANKNDTFGKSHQIDKSEIDTIAALYGKTYDEVLAELTQDGERKITITDFYDEDGNLKSGTTFTAEVAKTSVEGYTEAAEQLAEEQEKLSTLKQQLSQAEADGDQQEIDSINNEIDIVERNIDKAQQRVDELAAQTYDQFVTQGEEAYTIDLDALYAQGTASGLSGTNLEEYVNNAVAEAQILFNDKPIELKFTGEDGTTLVTDLLEGQTAGQAQSLAQAKADAELVGTAVGEAIESRLSEIKITYEYDSEQAALTWGEFHDSVQNMANEAPIQQPVEYVSSEEEATVEAPEVVTGNSQPTVSVGAAAEEGAGETAAAQVQQQIDNTEAPSMELQAQAALSEDSAGVLQTGVQEGIDSVSPYSVLVKMSEQSTLASDIDAAIPDSETIYVKADLTQAYNSLNVFKQSARQTITAATHAKGIHDSSTSHTALIGEAGPEIHQTSDGWYLAKGPQLAQIEKGDTVYNSAETKKIMSGGDKTKVRPRYASAYRSKWGYNGGSSSSSSKTGSTSGNVSATSAAADAEEAAEIWENTFDWLYNLTEDINEILRDREKLEREYDRILAKRNTTAKQLFDNVQDQLGVLETERQKQQEMYDKRAWEMQDYLSKNSDLAKYATYNWDDMTIEIDWDRIDAVTDEDTGEAIEDYVSKLEDIQDEMDDAEDELAEIEDRIQELLEMGKEEYFDFENLVFEALQAQKQALIDNASDISEAIADTNSNLLSSLSDSISKMREDRDLEDDRTSLEDQQKKLIYLQQDTSGGNALEILKLQQDIENAQQSYTDKLIDRKIDELQQQNDEASEQRERQIELAQEQLDQWSQSQEKWNEIHALWASSLNPNGTLVTDSVIMNALKDKDNYKGLSEYAQMDWLGTIEDDLATGLTWLANERQLEKIGKTSGEITFTDAQGEKHTGTINSDGSVSYRGIDNNGKEGTYTWKDVYENFDGSYRTFEENASFIKDPPPPAPVDTSEKDQTAGEDITSGVIKGVAAAILNGGYNWSIDPTRKARLTEVFGSQAAVDIQSYLDENWRKLTSEDAIGYGYNTMKAKKWNKYKTGGLADYTGPAWLDGTPSKPEIVLNAQDTKNFITLKNVLASLMSAPGAESTTNSTSNGDNYYDINISVESISNDYDVEQIANKVESMIVQDGLYRNVNSINRLK